MVNAEPPDSIIAVVVYKARTLGLSHLRDAFPVPPFAVGIWEVAIVWRHALVESDGCRSIQTLTLHRFCAWFGIQNHLARLKTDYIWKVLKDVSACHIDVTVESYFTNPRSPYCKIGDATQLIHGDLIYVRNDIESCHGLWTWDTTIFL